MDRTECEILLMYLITSHHALQRMVSAGIPDPQEYDDQLKFYVKTENKILDLMTEVRYPER